MLYRESVAAEQGEGEAVSAAARGAGDVKPAAGDQDVHVGLHDEAPPASAAACGNRLSDHSIKQMFSSRRTNLLLRLGPYLCGKLGEANSNMDPGLRVTRSRHLNRRMVRSDRNSIRVRFVIPAMRL